MSPNTLTTMVVSLKRKSLKMSACTNNQGMHTLSRDVCLVSPEELKNINLQQKGHQLGTLTELKDG